MKSSKFRPLKVWICNFISRQQHTVRRFSKTAVVISDRGITSNGSHVKEITDGSVYIKALFTKAAVENIVGNDGKADDWNSTILLLRDVELELENENDTVQEFVLTVNDFKIWSSLKGFQPKKTVDWCMNDSRVQEIAEKVFEEQQQKKRASAIEKEMTTESQSISVLLHEMGEASTESDMPISEQCSSARNRTEDEWITALRQPLSVSEFLIPIQIQRELNAIKEWDPDYRLPLSSSCGMDKQSSSVEEYNVQRISTLSGVDERGGQREAERINEPARRNIAVDADICLVSCDLDTSPQRKQRTSAASCTQSQGDDSAWQDCLDSIQLSNDSLEIGSPDAHSTLKEKVSVAITKPVSSPKRGEKPLKSKGFEETPNIIRHGSCGEKNVGHEPSSVHEIIGSEDSSAIVISSESLQSDSLLRQNETSHRNSIEHVVNTEQAEINRLQALTSVSKNRSIPSSASEFSQSELYRQSLLDAFMSSGKQSKTSKQKKGRESEDLFGDSSSAQKSSGTTVEGSDGEILLNKASNRSTDKEQNNISLSSGGIVSLSPGNDIGDKACQVDDETIDNREIDKGNMDKSQIKLKDVESSSRSRTAFHASVRRLMLSHESLKNRRTICSSVKKHQLGTCMQSTNVLRSSQGSDESSPKISSLDAEKSIMMKYYTEGSPTKSQTSGNKSGDCLKEKTVEDSVRNDNGDSGERRMEEHAQQHPRLTESDSLSLHTSYDLTEEQANHGTCEKHVNMQDISSSTSNPQSQEIITQHVLKKNKELLRKNFGLFKVVPSIRNDLNQGLKYIGYNLQKKSMIKPSDDTSASIVQLEGNEISSSRTGQKTVASETHIAQADTQQNLVSLESEQTENVDDLRNSGVEAATSEKQSSQSLLNETDPQILPKSKDHVNDATDMSNEFHSTQSEAVEEAMQSEQPSNMAKNSDHTEEMLHESSEHEVIHTQPFQHLPYVESQGFEPILSQEWTLDKFPSKGLQETSQIDLPDITDSAQRTDIPVYSQPLKPTTPTELDMVQRNDKEPESVCNDLSESARPSGNTQTQFTNQQTYRQNSIEKVKKRLQIQARNVGLNLDFNPKTCKEIVERKNESETVYKVKETFASGKHKRKRNKPILESPENEGTTSKMPRLNSGNKRVTNQGHSTVCTNAEIDYLLGKLPPKEMDSNTNTSVKKSVNEEDMLTTIYPVLKVLDKSYCLKPVNKRYKKNNGRRTDCFNLHLKDKKKRMCIAVTANLVDKKINKGQREDMSNIVVLSETETGKREQPIDQAQSMNKHLNPNSQSSGDCEELNPEKNRPCFMSINQEVSKSSSALTMIVNESTGAVRFSREIYLDKKQKDSKYLIPIGNTSPKLVLHRLKENPRDDSSSKVSKDKETTTVTMMDQNVPSSHLKQTKQVATNQNNGKVSHGLRHKATNQKNTENKSSESGSLSMQNIKQHHSKTVDKESFIQEWLKISSFVYRPNDSSDENE